MLSAIPLEKLSAAGSLHLKK